MDIATVTTLATLAGRPVVVGAGLAGMVAALDLAPIPCVLVTGGALGVDCASDWAQGGLAAAVGPDDDVDMHVADTLAAGAGLCDEDAVRRIVAAAPAVVEHLVALGARFDRYDDGTLRLGLEGAHSRHRIVHADGDGSGHEITRAVADAVRAADHVTVLEHTVARRLRTADDAPGAPIVAIELATAAGTTILPTDAVILATGGAGALFAHTTNPRGSWGSGLALGLRAGATARDLEMVQFHPTALAVGGELGAPMPLVSEAVRGEGAHLVDDLGRRVIDDDLAPRDVVSRAVWARLDAGRRVYLDTPRALGTAFHAEFPTITAKCAAAGLDPATDLLPVRPAAHYHMGGLVVDADARTTVPGLWAVGEVASTGLHGANRLASNSLLEAVVTGRAAAAQVRGMAVPATASTTAHDQAVWHHGAKRAGHDRSRAQATPAATAGQAPRPADRALLDRTCGVLRDEVRLTEAVRTLRPGAQDDNPRLLALLVAWSALLRTESRGGHTRTDHPRAAAPRHQDLTLVDALAQIDTFLAGHDLATIARSA
ncbi:MAG: L-aspartate oxidase [Austwickia sp.]|nr:L-aspartate oxidase [Actinomycetota bacterium]MCO5310976.1 L-aspartate oxidase [Austwickia sp.]